MGIVTKSIGSAGGRDYSTVQAWEDALPANLVTDGNSQVGECYADSEFVVNGTVLTIGGETTDASHTITLQCAAGQSFDANASRQTNALKYNASNGVALRSTAIYNSNVIDTGTVGNVFIDGLQMSGASLNGFATLNASLQTSAHPRVTNSIMLCNSNASGVFGVSLANCLVIQRGAAQGVGLVNHGGSKVVNTTIVRPSDISAASSGISTSPYVDAFTVKNVAIFGFSTGVTDPSTAGVGSNNATDLSAVGVGTSNQVSKTFTAQFVGTLDASQDFKVLAGAALIDNGVTDTTDIPSATDIVGTSRPQSTAWDIGCWEYVFPVAAAGASTMMMMGV